MPEFFKQYIAQLTFEQTSQLYVWLEENQPKAASEIYELVCVRGKQLEDTQ